MRGMCVDDVQGQPGCFMRISASSLVSVRLSEIPLTCSRRSPQPVSLLRLPTLLASCVQRIKHLWRFLSISLQTSPLNLAPKRACRQQIDSDKVPNGCEKDLRISYAYPVLHQPQGTPLCLLFCPPHARRREPPCQSQVSLCAERVQTTPFIL